MGHVIHLPSKVEKYNGQETTEHGYEQQFVNLCHNRIIDHWMQMSQ
jgi:hypothetical protein